MPESTDPFDQIASDLEATLAKLAREARMIERGKEAIDPDATMASLDLETGKANDLLVRLMGIVEATRTPHADGVDLVDMATSEASRIGRRLGFPLVVDLKLERGLPRVRVPEPALRMVVEDLLQLGAHAAGSGGTLTVVTRRGEDEVALLIEAHGGDNPKDPAPVALDDLVTELGGRLLCERGEDGVFRAGIALPSAIPTE